MANDTDGVDMSNYLGLLAGGAYDDELPTVTWDYMPGAPHSLPTCNVKRSDDVDLGIYNGIANQGYYSGDYNIKCINDLVTLFDEFSANVDDVTSWASSERDFVSKDSTTTTPTIDDVLRKARANETESAGGADDDDDAIIAYRVDKWRGEMGLTDDCKEYVENQRAKARIKQ